ncbi:hypothetical protein MNBD_GAMMA03-2079 [hydrothermal vent metagenome]|uniref:Methyltransferase type 11 domain-containing protein n=1 Tax=hydrothermal vent metagenome TaxID=652676 RepID=A0A3B0WAT2_9ZZZZ
MSKPEDIDEVNQRKYEEYYSNAQVSLKPLKKTDFFQILVDIRRDLIQCYGAGKKVLDIGCSTGDYLLMVKDVIAEGVGLDYTQKSISAASSKCNQANIKNIEFIQADAKNIPYSDKTFDLVYSFATLGYISEVERVIVEIVRILKKDGIAILEFGNLWNLNTLVCKKTPDIAISCHRTLSDMKKMIKKAGLEIIDWRSFQMFPYWGAHPQWIRLLLHPFWKKIMEKKIGEKMVDEWISNIPLIRNFSFRQMIICRKVSE